MCNELNLKFARLKHQATEQTEADQVLAAFCKFKGKCMNCGKSGHKLTECCSKLGNSKGEGMESKKAKSKKGTDKSTIKCFACGEMDTTNQNVPSLSLKRVPENKQ